MSRLDKIPVYFNERVFEKVFQIAEVSNLTKEEYMSYRSSLEQKWDYENVLSYAIQEAVEEAEKRKYVEGILEGKKETARKMKTQGLPIEKIAEFTDLSISQIEEL